MPFIELLGAAKARPVFGFPCDQQLALSIRMQSQDLQCPIYCVGEHALQIGGAAIESALQDSEAKKNLEDHLVKEHLLVLKLNPENSFDREVLEVNKRHELKRQELEQFAVKLQKIADREDINPWFLLAVAEDMIRYLRDRRCK